ncbi:MAG TPA: 2OG-Fe(II) oxygenase [Burkholderiaceae bacterium]|nr:2OG-Fe(II) oxygenase [Burkholderiaceae bacterium]
MQVAADLSRWLDEQVARGCSPQSLIDAMTQAGHARAYAEKLVSERCALSPQVPVTSEEGAASKGAVDAASAAPNALDVVDRNVQVLFASASPRIVLFGNLLSAQECEALIEASRHKIRPALVVDRITGEFKPDAARTSEGTHFEHGETELVGVIERRIASLLGFPIDQQEPMQILHYGVGGQYEPHYDYFDPSDPGSAVALKRGGQRVATLIMYLNDVTAGGATVFPQIGLEAKPQRGNAIYFENVDDDNRLDARTLHGGAPVGVGEKWIATKWIREGAWI